MSIGLMLQGRYPKHSAQQTLQLLGDAAATVFGPLLRNGQPNFNIATEDSPDGTGLYTLPVHAGGEPIEIQISTGSPISKPTITISANTGTLGAGYHDAVVRYMDELAKGGVEWEADSKDHCDETGYFRHRDQQKLRKEMSTYLTAVVSNIGTALADAANQSSDWMMWMSIDQRFEATAGDAVMLPMGPKSAAWFSTALANPALARSLHAWPEPGIGAEVLRNAALCMMWTEVAWCAPASERMAELFEHVLGLLTDAHRQDPALDMPWSEWKELAELCDQEESLPPAVLNNAAMQPSRRIGYRRNPIEHMLPGGLSMKLPGSMVFEGTEGDDGETRVYLGSQGVVRVTVASARKKLAIGELKAISTEPPEQEEGNTNQRMVRQWTAPELWGRSDRWTSEEPDEDGNVTCSIMTSASIARGRTVAFVTFVSDQDAPIDWVDAALDSLAIRDPKEQ